MFKGEATFWWEIVEWLLPANGEEPILWDAFVEAFYDKYFPESVRDQKEGEFLALDQGSMFVAAYKTKFIELARFAPHIVINEPTRARKFLWGLKLGICTWLVSFLLKQYFDVVNQALVVEQDNGDFRKV